jgi:hypothetical protein
VEVQGAFGAAVAFGSISQELRLSLQRFASEGRLETTTVAQGVVAKIALSVEEVLKRVQSFEDDIKVAPRPLKFEVRRYPLATVPLPQGIMSSTIDRIDERLTKLVAAKRAFEFLIQKPQYFFNPDVEKAAKRINTIENALDRLLQVREQIIKNGAGAAAVPDAAEERPLYYVPPRWEEYTFDCMLATSTPYLVAEVSDSEKVHYRKRGLLTTDTPPVWKGWEHEKLNVYFRTAIGSTESPLRDAAGELPSGPGTVLAKISDALQPPDNAAHPEDPIRIELARPIKYD